MSELVEPRPLEELKLVEEEEFQGYIQLVEELKPVDVEEKVLHPLVEEGCPVIKERVEELKPVDVEEKTPVVKELKSDQKLPFTFEWVEMSSKASSKSVTGEEYPVSKEELNCDKEPLPTQDSEEESLAMSPESVTKAAEPDPLEFYTFSLTNPRFDLLITDSNIKPRYHVILPPRMVRELPRKNVPVVLNSYGKKWTVTYNGNQVGKTLKGWKSFAVDNKLENGDCCFFELTENCKTSIVFKVVIMKTDSHSNAGCDNEVGCVSGTHEEPILIE